MIYSSEQEAKALRLIHQACAIKDRRMGKLRRLAKQPSKREAKRYQRAVLSDRNIVLATLVEQLCADGQEPGKQLPYSKVVEISNALNMWKATNEPVVLVPTLRGNGKFRWVHRLGLLEKSRNRLARQVACAITPLHPRQFILKGGLPSFEGWLGEVLADAQLILTTDIPSCFDTVRRTAVVSGLPLPGRVTTASLIAVKERAKAQVPNLNGQCLQVYDDTVSVGSKHRGISMGAALAQVGSEVVIRRILEAAEQVAGVTAASYGDNLIFILSDPSFKSSLIEAVQSAVAECFGADVIFDLTSRIRVTPGKKPVFFCGRSYSLVGGTLRRRVLAERIERFQLKVEDSLAEAEDEDKLDKVRRRVLGWINANRFSKGAVSVGGELLIAVGIAKAALQEKAQT